MFDLSSFSLNSTPDGQRIQRILNASLQAVEPATAVARTMILEGDTLSIDRSQYNLSSYPRVHLIAYGKASLPMADAAVEILSRYLTGGVVVSLQPPRRKHPNIRYIQSSHPLPDERSVQAARAIIDFLEGSKPGDLLLCLISGGGSAMLTAPVPGVSLSDLQAVTSLLLSCGASINEINTLRKHLDLLKGGGLAKIAAGATIITLVISDVVGDRRDVIASGPTVPDPTTLLEAWEILVHFQLTEKIPAPIRTILQKGIEAVIEETLKPGAPALQRSQYTIIASNQQAANAALIQAEAEGFHPSLLTSYLQGEAQQAGKFLGAVARQMALTGQPVPRKACLVAGGETTVTVKGEGSGGRNQELALASVPIIAGLDAAVLVSLATDGMDGPTDAAGAVVTGNTFSRAAQSGLEVEDFLNRNDSYGYFSKLDDLLKPGLTQTNVNDLTFIFTL